MAPRKRVIVVGGGFGGVKCVQTLTRKAAEALEVVLFNRENHLVFSPLLAEVVGSSINSLDVVVPLRQLLPNVFCRTEIVQKVHTNTAEVEYAAEDGSMARMPYDHLVLACGNVTNLNVVPGMADHGLPLKSVADAAALRSHLIDQMEQAEVAADPARRDWHLTVLVVGGGYSGVEAAGEINDLLRASAKYFRTWGKQEVHVKLIHSHDSILPEISPGLREFAKTKMEKAGVEMVLNCRVASATPEGVGLADGRFLRGGTIVCTIGNSAAPLIAAFDSAKQKRRLATEADMRVLGSQNVWAIGDCAYIINSRNGRPSPTTGQFAERQGRQCALNIIRKVRGLPTRPFFFKQVGELCSIGGHKAVADLLGMHLSGFMAWFIWRGVYLFKLPTLGRRLQVGFDWASLLVFPRDLAHVRTQQTDRVTHAHYDRGDYVFRRGEPASNFYVLENGEVEVVRAADGADGNRTDGEIVTVLGPGSFFGERALLNNRPRVMSVRARSPVDVLVMGKNVFTQISSALAPLRDALAKTLNRRTVDIWNGRQEIHDLLRRTAVRMLMEPVPQPLLRPSDTLRQASRAFVEHGNEFFFVSADGQTIEGVVTITDIIRSAGAGEMAVEQFMTRKPVSVSADDDCAVAATAIREYRLKTLPVVESRESRKLAGCIRVRRLMAYIFQQTAERQARAPQEQKRAA